MEQAKAAVSKFIGKSGHHDTEVHEHVNPAVTEEHIKPHRHEETTQAVDREVHQDHYHTTVQPLAHKEVLPEKHSHQVMPTQEREFRHGDHDKTKASVAAEAAQFKDTSTTHSTTQSTSQGAAAAGEHVHHHVHETVQPIINKETVAPEVVHTTVPIHEVHHAQSEHHGISTLPTKTLDEFKSLGGAITGGSHRQEQYEGHPRPYNPELQSVRSEADKDFKKHDGLHGKHETSGTTLTGGTTGTHVSGTSTGLDTGSGYTSGGAVTSTTGTALGGRTEGNTVSRAAEAVTGHSSGVSGTANGATTGGINRSLDNSSSITSHTATSGVGTHHDRDLADTSSSINTSTGIDTTRGAGTSSVQSTSQGTDPNLVEKKDSTLKGEGVPGSHSAVFGLTPDGKRYDDTRHESTSLKPAHSKSGDVSTSSGDIGSRAVTGSGVADQMHDPRVAEKGHGGSSVSTTSNTKPGAGAVGGEQGFGQIRSHEHGATSKLHDKLDPNTDADGDGKRGVMD